MARQLGILASDETWAEFIHRDTIKAVEPRDWKELRRIEGEEPDKIPGMLQEDHLFGGLPTHYHAVPTKYSGIHATVSFTTDTMVVCHEPLDKLIEGNMARVEILLRVPTNLLLYQSPNKTG